jgi:multicomponent Na+:H+ antiporter subunit G
MVSFVASVFVILGLVSIFIGTLGIYRFQDAFTRNHAASLIDTTGMILTLLGIAMLQQNYVNSFKVMFIVMMVFLLSPVSSHAIAKSIYICLKKKSDDGF